MYLHVHYIFLEPTSTKKCFNFICTESRDANADSRNENFDLHKVKLPNYTMAHACIL